jgi:branched-chain amino acid transport system substrate-binding protein
MVHLDRRSFLALAVSSALAGPWSASRRASLAAAPSGSQLPPVVRLAHLSHGQGVHADMGAAARMGAELGAAEAGVTAGMFGMKVELVTESAVTPENVVAAAERVLGQGGIAALIGALDDRTTAVLGDVAQRRGVLLLNAAARGGELRGERCHRFLFHVEPELAMYVHGLGQWLLHQKRSRWYVVASDDGAGQEIYRRGRQFLQAQGGTLVGHALSAAGTPDFAPVWRELAQANADTVVVALAAADLQRFLQQAKAAALALPIAGLPLDMTAWWRLGAEHATGVWIASWYHLLERYSGRELNRRFLQRFRRPMDSYAWASWAAGRVWGVDALIVKRWPNRWLQRLL